MKNGGGGNRRGRETWGEKGGKEVREKKKRARKWVIVSALVTVATRTTVMHFSTIMSNINPHLRKFDSNCCCGRRTTTCTLPCGDSNGSRKKFTAELKAPL